MLSHAYEYVCAVERCRNISRAADSLYITQSALTKYLNRLEENLGVRLFDRSSSPITMTPAGIAFAEKGRIILELERELLVQLNQLSDSPHGTLSVGITTEIGSAAMPYLLPRFYQMYPNIELQIFEGNNSHLQEKLRAGQIELAVLASPSDASNLCLELLQTETIILAIPADHPISRSYDLSSNSPLTPYYLEPERIRGENFIVCPTELGIGIFADEMFRKYQLEPNIVLSLRRNEAALRLASSGMGMVFTPVKTTLRISLLKPMAYFSIENPISTRRRYLCHNRSAPFSKPAALFTSLLQKCFQDEPELRQPICQLIFGH